MLIRDYINEGPKGKSKKLKSRNEELTHEDYENLMKHSSYKRTKGGLRQIR